MFLMDLLPWLIVSHLSRIAVILSSLAILFTILYMSSLFPDDYSKKLKNIFSVFAAIIVGCLLIVPDSMLPFILNLYFGLLAVTLPYACYILIVVVKRRRDGSFILSIGFSVLFIVAIHDTLMSIGLINSVSLLSWGQMAFIFLLFLFIVFQVFRRFSTGKRAFHGIDSQIGSTKS